MDTLESRIEKLEAEIEELREANRFLVLSVEYLESPRLPFIKFCSQNFIYGDRYSALYGYLVNLYNSTSTPVSNWDIDTVYSMLNSLGVHRGREAECLESFEKQRSFRDES